MNEQNNGQKNEKQNNDSCEKQGFSRRSFLQIAGGGGLALTAGCTGEPIGGKGWIPNQYEETRNFHTSVRGRVPIDPQNVCITRDDPKCILCGQCIEVCDREQAVMNHYDLPIKDMIPCIGCGQCTLWCPTSSITETDDTARLLKALNDSTKHVVVQAAPAVRAGLGESFGLPAGTNVEGKLAAALRSLEFDAVFDTNFAADLTIMEEAAELVKRLKDDNATMPMFTSCCPGWVQYCEMFYPELLPHLSTARSPMAMLGAVLKTYYAETKGLKPENVVSVAVMPCTAKKYECARPEMNTSGLMHGNPDIRDVDIVITTRELARLIKQKEIDFLSLPDGTFDDLLSAYSGGGAIFGNSGGVMEAAVRTAYHFVTSETPPPIALELKPIRGLAGIKEAALDVPGFGEVRIAVVSETANARKIIEKVKDGTGNWHFIEVMACQGGCISGGGQPRTALPPADAVRYPRTGTLYSIDEHAAVRSSHENPQIIALYENYLGKPCEGVAYELLHTHGYKDRSAHLTSKK